MMDGESAIGSEYGYKMRISGELEIDKSPLELPPFANLSRIKK